MRHKTQEWVYAAIAEVSFFAFLYYVQSIFGVYTNLWANSFILWGLLNLSIIFCPVLRKCYKR